VTHRLKICREDLDWIGHCHWKMTFAAVTESLVSITGLFDVFYTYHRGAEQYHGHRAGKRRRLLRSSADIAVYRDAETR